MAKKILALAGKFWPLLPVIAIGLYYAWQNAFIQDDAYISFNYAKWFSRGYGLVWYPGSDEYGYTNFLYTFIIGVAMLVGIPPEIASNTINVSSFIGCLIVGYVIAARILQNRWIALLPVIILATHPTFTAYATGGLETMLVSFLIMVFYWQILARTEANSNFYIFIGLTAALALLTRLDTALLLMPGYVYVLLNNSEHPHWKIWLRQLNRMREAIIIPLVAVSVLFVCCYLLYGYFLPTSFYIKGPGADGLIKYGVHYLILYNTLHIYLPFLVPIILIYFFWNKNAWKCIGPNDCLLLGVLFLWIVYILSVGGDFMEFRFLVPILLFYHLILFRLILILAPQLKIQISILVLLGFLAGNSFHANLFKSKPGVLDFNQVPKVFEYAFVESKDTLHDWLNVPNVNWSIIGKSLHELFYHGAADDVTIATGNVGAIPYYSDLKVFDILGLNSRVTLSNYNNSELETYNYEINRPGHRIIASDELLVNANVVLNFAFPHAVCKKANRYIFSPNAATLFPFSRHQTLFIPLNNGCYAVADYITPHPKIEELLKNKVIIRYKDIAGQTDCPPWLCLR